MKPLNITADPSTNSDRLGAAFKWAERRARDEPRKPALGVYVFECGGFYKVGIASDVRHRLSTAQVGCPFEIRIVSFELCDNARGRELRLHHALANAGYHVRGEWFKVPLMELVALLNVHLAPAKAPTQRNPDEWPVT